MEEIKEFKKIVHKYNSDMLITEQLVKLWSSKYIINDNVVREKIPNIDEEDAKELEFILLKVQGNIGK